MAARVMPKRGTRTIQTDTLTNLLTGMGGAGDKTTFTRFVNVTYTKDQLDAAYRNDWIARKIIDIPASDGTREWRSWQADQEQITKLETVEKNLAIKRKTMMAMQKARLYGGAAIIMGIAQGQPEDEVDVEAIKTDDLKFAHVVTRHELTAGPIEYDLTSPYYGEPQYYERAVTASGNVSPLPVAREQKLNATLMRQVAPGSVLRIHPSRVVRFIGLEAPDLNLSQGWGDPVLQIVADAILNAGTVAQGVAALVQECKIDVIKIPDLTAQIANKDYESRLKQRFGLASNAKSIYNMLLLDKEEEWERITQQFSTLPDIVQQYLIMASGAADIPFTRMMSESPKGLNATGQSDIRNYYDKVASDQEMNQTPALERFDEVMIRSALGSRPDELFYMWNPLWQLDDAQKADISYKKAQTFQIDVQAGILDGAVLKEARENQLIEDGTYPGIEQTIEDLGEPYEEPTPMLVAPGVDPKTGQPQKLLPPPAKGSPNAPSQGASNTVAADAMTYRVRNFNGQRTKKKTPRVMRKVIVNRRNSKASVRDAQPRTLYVRRDVTNAKAIIAWAKKAGLKDVVTSGMHVTIAYSRVPVDWTKAGSTWSQNEDGTLTIPPGGVRMVERLGDELESVLALVFTSSELTWRWCDIKERTGADWKWPDYQPHITLTMTTEGVDVRKIEAYQGAIELGPEIFEEVKGEGTNDAEKAIVPHKLVDDTPSEIMQLVAAIRDQAPPTITVPVHVTVPKRGKMVMTRKVTKRDSRGRIDETVDTEVEE